MTDFSRISRRDVLRTGAAAAAVLTTGGISRARAGAEIAFQALGDWGSPKPGQRAVAASMAAVAEAHGIDFVISTGDNFYPDGVTGTADEKFRTLYEEIYAAPALQVPWNVVLGNHDHRGDVQAQIDYSSINPRWRMPARYYRRTELLDGSAADFFYIDTTPIVHGHASWMRVFHDPRREQIEWLARELASSRAPWKIVVGHHPVFSAGVHGNSPALVAQVKPLLDRYRVQVYLNGHNHNLEHVEADDVHYLTSGGGVRPKPIAGAADGRFIAETLGFMNARLSAAEMSVEFFDEGARSLYRATIPVGA